MKAGNRMNTRGLQVQLVTALHVYVLHKHECGIEQNISNALFSMPLESALYRHIMSMFQYGAGSLSNMITINAVRFRAFLSLCQVKTTSTVSH